MISVLAPFGSIVAGFVVSLLIWFLCHNFRLGLWLVLALFLIDACAVSLPGLQAGIYLYPQDAVFLLIAVAALIRILFISEWTLLKTVWLGLGGMLFGSFLLGLVEFGKTAGVEFRGYFYFWTGTAYFMSFPLDDKKQSQLLRAWVTCTVAVLLLVWVRWLGEPLGLFTGQWSKGGYSYLPFRVINAAQTLFLAYSLIFCLYAWTKGMPGRGWSWLIALIATTVLVLRHRSVWAVVVISLLLILLIEKERRFSLFGRISLLAGVGLVVAIPLIASGYLDQVITMLKESFEEATNTRNSTFIWRVEGWQVLLDDWYNAGLLTHLFGSPFGSGFSRYLKGGTEVIKVDAHNHYVGTLLRVGMLGLMLLLASYGIALKRLYGKVKSSDLVDAHVLFILLAGQLTYFVTYSPLYVDSVIAGVAFALADQLRPAQLEASSLTRSDPSTA